MNINHPERHLTRQDLVDASGVCPLCCSRAARNPVFRVQDNPLVEWLFCSVCKGSSASMLPTDDYLDGYYRNYYQTGQARVTVRRPDTLAKHVAEMLPVFRQKDVSVLDFGGGDGTVAKRLAIMLHEKYPEKRVAITLVDVNGEPPEETGSYCFESAASLYAVQGQHFDVVLASAVLEHVPQMRSLLGQLLGLLAVGGVFYARTPYVVPLKQILRRYRIRFPMHVHDLGPSYWNRVDGRYPYPMETLVSQPSVVASGFSPQTLVKTCTAYLLKCPAHLENLVRGHPKDYFWNLLGGWEVLLRRCGERVSVGDAAR